jgi:hypothetical protein
MRHVLGVAAWMAVALVAVLIAAIAFGTLLWNRATMRTVQRLHDRERVAARTEGRPFSPDELEGLPGPVARYFQFALTPGQAMVRRARIQQTGEMAMRPGTWRSFAASEHFSVGAPGFVWDANIRISPLLPTYVRDGYVASEGVMYAALAGLVPVANQRGTPEMASGELLRYLAEAVWMPTALLPSSGVAWTAVSDSVAIAALTDGGTSVSLEVHFGERGEIVRVAAIRHRDVHGTSVPTPWVGRFGEYRRVAGMMIPMSGDVEWVLPDGPSPYWRGRIVSAEYDFARAM